MVRIYQPGNYQSGQSLNLSPEASQHVSVVLRMRIGEELTLFCGDNREFQATISSVTKKQVTVAVGTVEKKSRESPLSIHLAQTLSKGDRMEFVIQKAVELGVKSITPLITERCVIKLDKDRVTKKLHQWNAIVIAACEQSGRNTLPFVYEPVPFYHYINNVNDELRLISQPGGDTKWRDYPIGSSSVTVAIGPEGGFSDTELILAKEAGFHPITIGPRILRTETAAITVLSILQAVGGDL